MNFVRIGDAGLRGIVGDGLDLMTAMNYSAALGTWYGVGALVIACDTRASSPMLKNAITSSFMATGHNVYDAGIIPAPMLQYLIKELGAEGGCLVGAGHHDAGWNALQAMNSEGGCLNAFESQEVIDIYHSRLFDWCAWDNLGALLDVEENLKENYLDEICRDVDIEAIRQAKLKVIADFCNGSGSKYGKKLFAKLGVELIPLNDEQKSFLPHAPEPRPRSAYQVKSLMENLRADIGFVFNSDAARMSVVSSDCETLSEEMTFPLVASSWLKKQEKGGAVVCNTCTTKTLNSTVENLGFKIVHSEVGQAATLSKMLDHGAVLGGDGSGSVIFANGVPGFDGFKSCVEILENMALTNKSSAELIASLERYHIKKANIPCEPSLAFRMRSELMQFYKDATMLDETDGLRFSWKDGWIHLRLADTEPVVRVIVEWTDAEIAREKVREVQRFFRRRTS